MVVTKKLALLSTLVLVSLGSIGSAYACPNISGKFQMDYEVEMGRYIEFQQTDCKQITLRACGIASTGKVYCDDLPLVWILDGKLHENCEGGGICERTFTSDSNFIQVTEVSATGVTGKTWTIEHGTCFGGNWSLSLDSNHNLVDTTPVHDCSDGFNGSISYARKRMN